jgi:hypothetical protein
VKKILLRLLLLPKGFYSSIGIQTDKLKAILTAKLLMDERIPQEIGLSTKKKKPLSGKWASIIGFILTMLVGAILIFPLVNDVQWILALVLFFTMFIIILAALLIASYTNILLDTKDNQIILPKPVNDRTFLAARLMHMVIFILNYSIPISIPAIIAMVVIKGWHALWIMLLLLPFAMLFTVFILNLLYLLLLRFTSVNLFKNIITYFQVIIAIVIYGGYQIVPRLLRDAEMEKWKLPEDITTLFIPTYWWAAAWESLYPEGEHTVIRWVGAVFSFLIPLIMMAAMVIFLGPVFLQKINALATSSSDPVEKKNTDKKKMSSTHQGLFWYQRLSRLFTRRGAERMAFEFTWSLTGRNRDFKLMAYPAFGYFIMFFAFAIFRFSEKKLKFSLPDKNTLEVMIIIGSYFLFFFIMTAIDASKYSDKRKAAWIYHIPPVQFPGAIISGAVKSILCKFALPIFVVLGIAGFWLIGWTYIPNFLLTIGMVITYCFLYAYLSYKHMPFSRDMLDKQKGGSFFISLFLGSLPFIFGGLHYLIFKMLPVVILLMLLSFASSWLLISSLYQKRVEGWNFKEEAENDV